MEENKEFTTWLPKATLRGFTLIELMIAVAIIAVLVAVGMAVYVEVQKKARDSRRMQDVRAVQNAAEVYYSENGSYPTTTALVAGKMESQIFPTDPKSGWQAYNYVGTASAYTMCAKLEKTSTGGSGNASDNTGGSPVASGGTHFCARSRQ